MLVPLACASRSAQLRLWPRARPPRPVPEAVGEAVGPSRAAAAVAITTMSFEGSFDDTFDTARSESGTTRDATALVSDTELVYGGGYSEEADASYGGAVDLFLTTNGADF